MATPQALSHHDYTIGWVCALRSERTAATVMLDDRHEDLPNLSNDPNVYTLGSIGKHNIVIACLPEGNYGASPAAKSAAWMASSFPRIRFGLMVGIGGGIPGNDVRLGDIVVSKPDGSFPGVVQWDRGKIRQDGTFEQTGSLNNPPTTLLNSLSKLGTDRETNGCQIQTRLALVKQKWPRLAPEYTSSESLRDILFADNYPHIVGPSTNASSQDIQMYDAETEEEVADCNFCDITKAVKRKSRANCIHYGLIASGNAVIKNAQFRNNLNARFGGKLLCVEMEAAGLMNDFPCLVIRGICDYADSHKNETWQNYAATVAAAFAKDLLLVVPSYEVDKLSVITPKIRDGVQLAVGYLEEARTHRHTQNDERILGWLSPLDYGVEHSDVLNQWEAGTGQWLLESAEFKAFIETNKPILFCPGIPGAGKTVMTAVVIDYLHKRFAKDSRIGIAHVYFNFKRHREQTPEAVFLSLLKQLAQTQSVFPTAVQSLHKTHAERKTRPLFGEIIKTFRALLSLYSGVFVAVDALDECVLLNDCRERFLSEIIDCSANFNLKLFITSRDLHDISYRLQSALRLDVRATELDIRKYIDSRLSRLAPTSVISRNRDMYEKIKDGIAAAVSGMFLLAQLHFDRLRECATRSEVIETLENLPTGSYAYDHAYSAAMDRINNNNQQSSSWSKLAINALSWITHAKRPLSPTELQHALAVVIGTDVLDKDNLPQIDDIVSSTVGLVTVDKERKIIRLVHYTAQEFFERNKNRWLPNAERYIAEVCSSYLSYSAFGNGCCKTIEAYDERRRFFKLYKYAVEYWKHHVAASGFSQIHIDFLEKTSNVEAFLQLSQFFSHYSKDFMDLSDRDSLALKAPGLTGLHVAAKSGWNEIVEALLRGVDDADVRDQSDRSPFFLAACGGHDTVMKTLLNHGQVDINVKSKLSEWNPLICAAQGNHISAIKLLLDTNEINIGSQCAYKKTALWYAAVSGHVDAVRLLVAWNYDTDMVCEIHFSALMGAVIMGQETIVKLLLEAGYANINAQTTREDDPTCWCLYDHEVYGSDNDTWRAPYHEQLWRYMEDTIDPADCPLSQGKSPFYLAVELERENLVKLFLSMEEVDVDLPSCDGSTALFAAIELVNENIFQLLADSGRFDMASRNDRGQTPLMYAASKGYEGIVEILLNQGAVDTEWMDDSD